MPNYKPIRPLSIREKGLRVHLGPMDYDKFVSEYNYQKRTNGRINYAELSRATEWSRNRVYNYVAIYEEEQSND